MYPYIPNTPQDEKRMLEFIGLETMDDLFNDIPEEFRLKRDLNLKPSMSELEVTNYMTKLAKENKSVNDLTCFLGAGAYDHYIPTVIGHVTGRSEFYTSYTPYQAEISQGTLQYIFEFQTMICEITGMEVANASMYDAGTAIAEAAFMAANISRKNKIIVSETVAPQHREVLNTYAHLQNLEVVVVKMDEGSTDMEDLKSKVDEDTAAVIVQSPNFFGVIEDLEAIEKVTHSEKKAMLITSVDPISMGILKKPGEMGADIVVGEGQALGIPLSYGGPYLGFMATTKKHMRKLPGRIVGQTIDADGERAFVLTLQAREQHIRRDKATSNICSNQGLNALAATVYLATMGKEGLKEVAMQATQKAHYAQKKLIEAGYKPLFDKPFFKEFAVVSDKAVDTVNEGLLKENILGGYNLGKDFPQYENASLYAVTEKRTKEEIDHLSSVLEGLI